MRFKTLAAAVALIICGAAPARAQGVELSFHDGLVTLRAHDVLLSTILAEWARVGRATILNGNRVSDSRLTFELADVPEGQALDVLLRSASGYILMARAGDTPGVATFDRILVATASSAPSAAFTAPPEVTDTPGAFLPILRQRNPDRRDD